MTYQEAVELNAKIIPLVLEYQRTSDLDLLLVIHNMVAHVSRQEIRRIQKKFGSEVDLLEDLIQDAYLRIKEGAKWFDPRRSPSFLSYWRTTFRNHLKSKYRKVIYHVELESEPQTEDETAQELDSSYLRVQIRRFVGDLLIGWGDSNAKLKPLVLVLLEERILRSSGRKSYQSKIGVEFGVTQSFVSMWEKWLLEQIRAFLEGGMLETKPEGSIHSKECVITLTLDRTDYSPEGVRTTLQDFLIRSLEPAFAGCLPEAAYLPNGKYDLRVRYSCGLESIYKILLQPTWVLDGFTKPVTLFGTVTSG